MQSYINKAENFQVVLDSLLPPVLEVVLGDYNRTLESGRDHEVLNLIAAILVRLGVCVWSGVDDFCRVASDDR